MLKPRRLIRASSLRESGDWKMVNTTAWMVDRKGTMFPVIGHLYIYPKQKYANVQALTFLYETVADSATKYTILSIFHTWAEDAYGRDFTYEELCSIDSSSLLTNLMSDDFYADHFDEIKNAGRVSVEPALDILRHEMCMAFMKVRYEGDLLSFRISSQGFNWSPVIDRIILDMVNRNKELKYISVTREDEHKPGKETYYGMKNQQDYAVTAKVPINDFLDGAPGKFESDDYLLMTPMSSSILEDIRTRIIEGQSLQRIMNETNIPPVRLSHLLDSWNMEQRDFTRRRR